ncbi:inositol monophosphatase family protein [Galactobacter valiniphilus]|uniref:inositol monophosphatase family protein n=1 Tax=Galactobacter valiniphilus TaxID=2676122 RepID=UPI003736C98D
MSPPIESPELLLELAVAAAASAAPRLEAAFAAGTQGATVSTKTSRHDLVTELDRGTEASVVEHLASHGPTAAYLGEELGRRGSGELTWVIDPIDGTSNFVHGLPTFAISIAACVGGVPVAGVIHAPATGEVYAAVPDAAWLGGVALAPHGRGEAARNALATDHPGGEAVRAEGDAALRDLGALIEAYATVRRPVCASLSLAGVAAGSHDVVLGVDVKPWDVAAGALLVTATGGRYDALSYASDAPGASPVFRPCYVASAASADPAPARGVLEALVDRRDRAGYVRPLPR